MCFSSRNWKKGSNVDDQNNEINEQFYRDVDEFMSQ